MPTPCHAIHGNARPGNAIQSKVNMKTVFNIKDFGAVGDGYHDDHPAIQSALLCAIGCSGALYFPPGMFLCPNPITYPENSAKISFFGDGANVSTLYFQNCAGIDLSFSQNGQQQPYGLTMRNIGLRALGKCGTAIRVSYGAPPTTNDHNQPSLTLSNVQVMSDGEGSWDNGIDIEGAWNPLLENVWASGDSCGGNWNAMRGVGVNLRGMCVNAHLSNVRTNFWAVGLQAHSTDGRNTEGIFCNNCSMVGVKRGVWIKGDPLAPAPRISTLTWTGGLIECRVGGVTGGSAALHLEHVWTALISACQMITETISLNVENTYAVTLNECHGVVVTACDMNAFIFGLATVGACEAINTNGNTFTNTAVQTVFNAGTIRSRSYGHTLVNVDKQEWDPTGVNMIGWVN